MPTLKKWLRKKLPWGTRPEPVTQPVPDPPPFLPVERPSILTPSPSQDSLVSYMDNYGSFGKLPYEIRRQILVEAFGGRTLHIDLIYKNWSICRKFDPTRSFTPRSEYLASKKNRTWGWYACECHQASQFPDEIPRRNYGERLIKNPRKLTCVDGCRSWQSHAECGPFIDGKLPLKCRIGVKGWLLACRQAYIDSIEILFATNTFHISNYELQINLPRIVLPQRLQAIQSLELSCDFRTSVWRDELTCYLWAYPKAKDSSLHELCHMLPKWFPRLRQLDIRLTCQLRVDPPRVLAVGGAGRVVLRPIEDMIRVLGPGRDVCVAMQQSVYVPMRDEHFELYGPKFKYESYNPYRGRFWRELDPDNGLGYWICDGIDDRYGLGRFDF